MITHHKNVWVSLSKWVRKFLVKYFWSGFFFGGGGHTLAYINRFFHHRRVGGGGNINMLTVVKGCPDFGYASPTQWSM